MNIFEDYLNHFYIKDYKANQVIFNEGDTCQYLGLVLKGVISISTYTYFEKEYNILTGHKDDIFGENLLFSSDPIFLGSIISKNDSRIGFISKIKLIQLLTDNQNLLCEYLNTISNKFIQTQNKVKLLSQKSIREKVLFYLVESSKKNKTDFILVKSKEDLADLLNIPRPSLSRELINLKKLNLIDYNRYKIWLKKKL